jgi:hypothetical protein
MKTLIGIVLFFCGLSIIILFSCNNPDKNEITKKEFEPNEKIINQKDSNSMNQSNKAFKENSATKQEMSINQSSVPDADKNIHVAKVPLTKAADVSKVHPQCNEENTPIGDAPLVDMYCGVLGKKAIEIYITSQNEKTKTVKGYSVVGNSRVNFEGKYTSHIKKGSDRKDFLDFDETIYSLIMHEPVTSNKNGVFMLDLHINDTWRNGSGKWTSYDGMLFREIVIYDRLNPDF